MIQKTYTVTDLVNKATNWYFNLKPLQQFIILAGVIIILAENAPKTNYNFYHKLMPLPRKDFADTTKRDTVIKQGFVCNSCRNRSNFLDFHHMNGDRSNNCPSNCEALCPNCHAAKTRKRKNLF